MSIIVSPLSFEIASDLVQPIAQQLCPDDLFDHVKRIQLALDEITEPPLFMSKAVAARYVRRRFAIPLTRKNGPPVRRIGPQLIFARHDLDKWAARRIATAPQIVEARGSPRQPNKNRQRIDLCH